ncbi:MAG TPA: hypothetical protein VFX73_04300 [Chitinophagaceae bacterium]|nr:hypothetical protein [Chitinophagaceae bacterium]
MFRALFCLLTMAMLFSCKQGKRNLSSDESITAGEFVESFSELKLPYNLHDSVLSKKLGDTALISAKLVKEFIPDSLYKKDFKSSKPKFYVLGRAVDKNEDSYLIFKAATKEKQVAYVACFDKEHVFKAGMTLVTSSSEKNVENEGALDRRFTLIRNRKKIARDGQVFYTKNVYVYNNAGTFTLILTESNEVPENAEIFNPIDSLPMTFKLSGNYVKDKRNFVTIRDGSKPNRLLFFVHFEKNNGDCIGELKGEVELIQPALARYTASGDPCSLEFKFDGKKVTLTELSGCGNHRGIRCFFNDSYPKKIVKPKKKTQARTK